MTKIRTRLCGALGATLLVLPAPAAQAAPGSQASMRVTFPDGTTRWEFGAPEYRVARMNGGPMLFTVTNTGQVPLQLEDAQGCDSPIAPGDTVTCGRNVYLPEGAPGTTADVDFPVTATADGSRLTEHLTLSYTFYDVLPQAMLSLAAAPAASGTPGATTVQVLKYPPMPWVRTPDVVSLTSATFGDLLDPANPRVTGNTCPESGGLQTCEFTAVFTGASGAVAQDTVAMVLSDGTGPTNTLTASVDVALPTSTPSAPPTTAPDPTPSPTGPTGTASPTPSAPTTTPATPTTPPPAPPTTTAPATPVPVPTPPAPVTPTAPASPTTAVPGAPAPTPTSTPSRPTKPSKPTKPAKPSKPSVRDARGWTKKGVAWPRVRVDGMAVGRRTSTRALFAIPQRCATVVPARLDALLARAPRTKGGCAQQWRLARAATVAVLNEASLRSAFPAKSAQNVVTQTDRTLRRGSTATMARLARTFEHWNRG